ncbi:MAG: PAS domain S-box protein, partial [candidate division Zixibacteria bacterium]|nr:PAS domain S-box protein [candidate division Zixibacteria bacterium]
MRRIFIVSSLIAAASALTPTASAVDRFDIDFTRDPRFLPYVLIEKQTGDWGTRKIPVIDAMQVYRARKAGVDTALVVYAFNRDLNRDGPASFCLNDVFQGKVIDQEPLYVTLTGFTLYNDTGAGVPGIIGGCYRNDSAFVVRIIPGTDRADFLYLTSGIDHTGNGLWEAGVGHVLTEDYDYDGIEESFFYVGPGRDLEPRVLYCLEPQNLKIEWSLPVAATVSPKNLYSCRDSTHPAVIFAAYNVKNGVTDANFSDQFCYLTKVNNRGEILYNRIISEEHGSKGLWPGEKDGLFYVFHGLPMLGTADTGDLPPHRYQLSKIDRDCRPTVTVDIADRLRSAWLSDYDGDGRRDLYTLSHNGVVRIFDTSLTLLAMSEETNLDIFMDTVRLAGHHLPAFLFASGDGVDLFSHDFRRLSNFPRRAGYYHPLAFDANDNVTHFVLSGANTHSVIQASRRGLLDLVRILFWELEYYILIALALLALALVIVNSFRHRAVRRLAASEEKLRTLLETVPDYIVTLKPDGTFEYINRPGPGFELSKVIESNALEYFVPEDRERFKSALEGVVASGKETSLEVRTMFPENRVVWLALRIRPSIHDGTVQRVTVVATDLTDLREHEKALRESEEKYRILVESAAEIIFALSRDGAILFFNIVAAKKLGGSPDDFIGMNIRDIFPADVAAQHLADVEQVFATGEGRMVETETVLLGEKYFEQATLQPIRGPSGEVIYVMGVARDLTRHVEMTQQLASERDFVHSLLETANSLILCLDSQARITVFNRECERITGYHRSEVIGRPWPDIFLPEDHRHHALDSFSEWVRAHPSDRYEGPIITKSGDVRTILWSNSAILSDDSDKITAIAVGQDITDRKAAERALQESERRFRELADLLPQTVFETDLNGRVTFCNRQGMESFGFTQQELERGIHVDEVFAPHEQERARSNFRKLLKHEPFDDHEYIAVRRDGSTFTVIVYSNLVVRDNKTFGIRGVLHDITERKKTEDALKQSEQRYALATTAARVGVWDWNVQSGQFYIDPSLKANLGYEDHEIPNEPMAWAGLSHPEDREKAVSTAYAHMANGTPDFDHTQRMIHKDGSIRWLLIRGKCICDVNGEAVRMLGTGTDITDLKKGEEAVKEAEARFIQALGNSLDVLYRLNLETRTYDYVSLSVKDTIGYTPEEVISLGVDGMRELAHPEDLSRMAGHRQSLISSDHGDGGASTTQYRLKCKDGQYRWLSDSHTVIRDGRRSARFIIGSVRDVTDQKQAEEVIRASEEKYRLLVENVRAVIALVKYDGQIVFVNRVGAEHLSRGPGDVTGHSIVEMFPSASASRMIHNCRQVIDSGKEYIEESQIATYNGSRWYHANIQPFYDSQAKAALALVIATDVTESRRAREALQESEEKFRSLAESTSASIFIYKGSGIIYANPTMEKVTGYSREELLQMPFWELVRPDRQEAIRNLVTARQRGETLPPSSEFPYVTKAGEERWCDVSGCTIEYGGEKAYLATAFDITDRKRAEETLHYRLALEELVATISTHFIHLSLEAIDEGINHSLRSIGLATEVDRSYVFLFSEHNTRASNTHEWCADGVEPLKEALADLETARLHWWMDRLHRLESIYIPRVADLPDDGASDIRTLKRQSLKSLVAVPMVYRGTLIGLLGLDSTTRPKEWSDEDITLLRMVGEIFVNALQRKQAEMQVQQTNEEKISQAKLIAGGFAHEIRNALFPAKGALAQMAQMREGTHPDLSDFCRIIDRSVSRAVDMTKLISRFTKIDSNYEPEEVDLADVVADVIAANELRIAEQHVAVQCRPDRQGATRVVSSRPQLFMAVDNLIRNSLDALTKSQKPAIFISWVSDAGFCHLTVGDNGSGIAPKHITHIFDTFYSTKPGKGTGIGLAMVKKIVEMYGGRISVS